MLKSPSLSARQILGKVAVISRWSVCVGGRAGPPVDHKPNACRLFLFIIFLSYLLLIPQCHYDPVSTQQDRTAIAMPAAEVVWHHGDATQCRPQRKSKQKETNDGGCDQSQIFVHGVAGKWWFCWPVLIFCDMKRMCCRGGGVLIWNTWNKTFILSKK